jgi:hypothetical protein
MRRYRLIAIGTKYHEDSSEVLNLGRKKELDELIAAFGRRARKEHSNSARIGCPGMPALTRLVTEPEALGRSSLLDHLRHCAACLDELRELRRSSERLEE